MYTCWLGLLIMAMLIISSCVEMFVIVPGRKQGEACGSIVAAFQEYHPVLKV